MSIAYMLPHDHWPIQRDDFGWWFAGYLVVALLLYLLHRLSSGDIVSPRLLRLAAIWSVLAALIAFVPIGLYYTYRIIIVINRGKTGNNFGLLYAMITFLSSVGLLAAHIDAMRRLKAFGDKHNKQTSRNSSAS